MKKLLYLVAEACVLFASCEGYDDTALKNQIQGIEDRLTELENTVKALNQDIAGVETLVDAMQKNVYVSKSVEGAVPNLLPSSTFLNSIVPLLNTYTYLSPEPLCLTTA